MSRKPKKPDYNSESIMKELLNAVSECYGTQDGSSESLRYVSREFDFTHLKTRKLLITAGAYSTEISDYVNSLKNDGKSVPEIMQATGLSRASVHSYLPYTKVIYNAKELSLNAERIRKYRERQAAVEKICDCIEEGDNDLAEVVWDAIKLFQNYPFYTARNLKYKYTVKGNEMFVDRKEKSITRATVDLALINVLGKDRQITGPKQLGVFGASYLYPIFRRFDLNFLKN